MSEKRFVIDEEGISDNKTDKWYCWKEEVVDLLNEQQATISQLEEENKKLIEEWEFSFRTEMAHHRFAEKELQEKIREKQATISRLEEKNGALKKFIKDNFDEMMDSKMVIDDEL